MARDYEEFKARQANISRERSKEGRDIGPLPKVKSPKRKTKCRRSLRAFCETYLANQFPLAWSPDHLDAIQQLETTILDGGQYAFAMPRGSGKTTLCQAAVEWATVYGHRRFVVLIGATEPHAEETLDAIRADLETNDLLADDFPEVCHPIRSLERIVHRCNGQTLDGVPTRMSWAAKEMVFPIVKKSKASGIVLRVAGITGRVRGMRAAGPDGNSVRPDLVIVDDPQTDESARSPSQNAQREQILTGAILGLAGPKTKIAACMPCTVIAPGDMADRILDRERNPQWHGKRAKLIYQFPTNEKMWDEYARIRRESMRGGGTGVEANDFYFANRIEMDQGARVGWPERYNVDEHSAVQHAMNLRIDKPNSFAAEYQNSPMAELLSGSLRELDPDTVSKRLNGLKHQIVPRECNRLTAMIDVGSKVHWFCVVAWDETFGGSIIDYGPWPRQNRAYFAANDARPHLETLHPDKDEPGRVYAGLVDLTAAVLGRPYQQEGGAGHLHIDRCLVDSGWLPDPIFRFCRESQFASVLIPSKGYSVGAKGRPMSEWARKPGERLGWNWRMTPQTGSGRGRLCVFDPNVWKSFTVDRLLSPMGSPGALKLYGQDKESWVHQLFSDHLCSEFRTRTEGRGRTVDEWQIKPGQTDNHLWDTVVGAAVAANVQGLEWQAAALAGLVTSTPTSQRVQSFNGGQNPSERKHIVPGGRHIKTGSPATGGTR